MRAKFLAACAAALMLLPMMVQAASFETSVVTKAKAGATTMAKAGNDVMTPEDYIEYASLNDVDIHEIYFSTILYEGTQSCLMCHMDDAEAMLGMGHFKWQNPAVNIEGAGKNEYGKNQLLNNFCIAIPSNEGRCTQCHAGYGYADDTFDFNNPVNIDCLVCHDQSNTYAKAPTTAGMPVPSVDLNAVARSIALGAQPQRKNCINCHAKAGGGDNVKHGDISTDLIATTREFDVHMGVDGANLVCADCHGTNHKPDTGAVNHGMAGMSLHSVNEGEMKECTDCHGDAVAIHQDTPASALINPGWHDRLACQVCHIPAIARAVSTKVEWYWADAGQNVDPIPVDPETGRPTYDKKKGTFVWANDVRPVLRYSNGTWNRKLIGVSDSYSSEPIDLASPIGSYSDEDAMIYPFKKMIGNQPVDPVNGLVVVPHLFGMKGGPNPYWGKYDWDLAIQDGQTYTGQPYSGTYGFASTEMLLSVNHEVAPKAQALGAGPAPDNCMDCHVGGGVEWDELGWTGDPLSGGQRVDGGESVMLDRPAPTRMD